MSPEPMTDDSLARGFAQTPANKLLGSRLVGRDDESAHLVLPVRGELIQEGGVVHGGFLATLADSAAVQVLLPTLLEGAEVASIEFKLNFLRPCLADGGDIHARSSLIKRGRRICLLDVELHQADRLVAKGLFTYLISRPDA